jgi:hypothetical protein
LARGGSADAGESALDGLGGARQPAADGVREPRRPSLAVRLALVGLVLRPLAEEACEGFAHRLLVLDRDEGSGDAVVKLEDEADL